MVKRTPLNGAGIGILFAVPCLLLVVFAAGGGHGTYLPAKLLFPFAMLAAVFGTSITTFHVALALLQFPLYGLFLGAVFGTRLFTLCLIVLAAAHCAAAAIDIFAPADDSFARSHATHLTRRCS